MTENTTPGSSARRAGHVARLAPLAFGLSVVSVLAYFVTSEGIHNFVAYLLEMAAKVIGRRP